MFSKKNKQYFSDRSSPARCKLLVTLGLLINAVFADEARIIGYRYSDGETAYAYQTNNNYHYQCSLMGGAEYIIHGKGFASTSGLNTITFEQESHWGGVRAKSITVPTTENDSYKSIDGFVGFTTPNIFSSLSTPVAQATLSSILPPSQDQNYVNYFMYVTNQETGEKLDGDAWNHYYIRFSQGFTPHIVDVVPNQVYAGQEIQFLTITNFAVNNDNGRGQTDNRKPVEELKIGRYNTGMDLIEVEQYQYNHAFATPWTVTMAEDALPSASELPSARYRVGNSVIREGSAKHCNFANDDCWYVRILPRIDNIDKKFGSLAGNQELVITGQGLQGQTSTVQVDGVDCAVQSSSEKEIRCLTGAKSEASVEGYQPGQPGILQTTIDREDGGGLGWGDRTSDSWTRTEAITTTFEYHYNKYDTYSAIMKGFFKAPETGRYRFHLSSDDQSRFWLDETENTYPDPNGPRVFDDNEYKCYRNYWCSLRRFHSELPETVQQKSDWIELVKDQFYPVEGYFVEGGGSDHMTVAVEYKPSTEGEEAAQTATWRAQNHFQASREIQLLEVENTGDQEEWTLDITVDADNIGRWFKIYFLDPRVHDDPEDKEDMLTNEIPMDCGNSRLRGQINNYFEGIFGHAGDVDVYSTITYIDSEGNESMPEEGDDSDTELGDYVQVKRSFRVVLRIFTGVKSFENSQLFYEDDADIGSVEITPPATASSEPLGYDNSPDGYGYWKIVCPNPADPDNEASHFKTVAFRVGESDASIQYHIDRYIPHLTYKQRTYYPQRTNYYQRGNGFKLVITMEGYEGVVPQCFIENDDERPIPETVSFITKQEKLREYGESLWWESIPMEMLYTEVMKPQVRVQVDGLDAICYKQNCDYLYKEDLSQETRLRRNLDGEPLVNSFTFDSNTNSLEIEGDNFEDRGCSDTATFAVTFAGQTCTIDASTQTTEYIECTMLESPAAGSHKPTVSDSCGAFVISDDVDALEFTLTVASVSPSAVHQLGSEMLTITGTYFGTSMSQVSVEIVEKDTQTFVNNCELYSVGPNEIKCLTTSFIGQTDGTQYDVKVTVNDQPQLAGIYITLSVKATLVDSISPTYVSPVLETELEVQLSQDYNYGMDVTDFRAELRLTSEQTEGNWVWRDDIKDFEWVLRDVQTRKLYIKSVDPVTKIVTLKFKGATRGDHAIALYSKQAESSLTILDELSITAGARITGITPTSGSLYGGTEVTITGENFSEFTEDNPVIIGDAECIVSESTATQIKCQIERRIPVTDPAEQQQIQTSVLVILKLTEYADCAIETGCTFLFDFPTCQVDGLTEESRSEERYGNLFTITGSGFNAQTSLLTDGFEAQLIEHSDDTAVFLSTGVKDQSEPDIEVFCADGLPTNYDTQVEQSRQYLGYTFYKITPTTGYTGGTLLTIWTTGIGTDTDVSQASLAYYDDPNSVWVDFCFNFEWDSSGRLTCRHDGSTYPATAERMTITNYANTGHRLYCANGETETAYDDNCFYHAAEKGVSINSVTISGSPANIMELDITIFSDLNFLDDIFTDFEISYRGVNPNQPYSMTMEFPNGIPIADSDDEAKPVIVFRGVHYEDGTTMEVYADVAVDYIDISADLLLSIAEMTSDIECSFAGGCQVSFTAPGLTSALTNSDNYVEVCGEVCELDTDDSDALMAFCRLPPLITEYSVSQFELAQHEELVVEWKDEDDRVMTAMTDGVLTIDLDAETGDDPCIITAQAAGDNHLYMLSEFRFFVTEILGSTLSPNLEGLIFQGLVDGAWDDLWTVDSTVHVGWNSVDFDNKKVSQFRIKGDNEDACAIGEAKATGIKIYNDDSESVSCSSSLILGSDTRDLSTDLTITYSKQNTPTLDSMSTRFVSVLGGDEVVFSGQGFQSGTRRFLSDGDDDVFVQIDGRTCTVTDESETQITCTTSDKPSGEGTVESELKIFIPDKGYVATQGKFIFYVSKWSDTQTWGGFPPGEDDAVSIPKGLNLLFDIDASPLLQLVNVEGALLFEDSITPRTFDCYLIMNNGGYIEIGTEESPYMGDLTITMHGDPWSPKVPLFGNKVIATLGSGQIEMHGAPRSLPWHELGAKVEKGESSITLNELPSGVDSLDWQVGESIVIASSDFDGQQAEERIIKSIDGLTLTLDRALEFKHLAGEFSYNDSGEGINDVINMRAEVGLLSRNLKFKGDDESTQANNYGAHIMLAGEGVRGKFSNIQLNNVGQAFKLGRYPIHFHMAGNVAGSYIKNNVIHSSNNRGITLHAVRKLRLEGNVIYKNLGHSVFIEDGIETDNEIINNLVVDTRRTFSLLITDQTPASFWIQHPDNIFVGNHAAGSDRYGFWFDLPDNPTGPSADITICPINSQLGQFEGNVAHSNVRYGLRIFHGLMPRRFPCRSIVQDSSSSNFNPSIKADFKDNSGYKNSRNGMISQDIGDVTFTNFKAADNMRAGMEISTVSSVDDGFAKIIGGFVVGRSGNFDDELINAELDASSPVGIITPRGEGLTIYDTRFYEFQNGVDNFGSALETCSQCDHPASTDSGARTVTLNGLQYPDASVGLRVRFGYPDRGILFDQTGSTSDFGEDSWILPNFKHNKPEDGDDTCLELEGSSFIAEDGMVCNNEVQVRRLAFSDYQPSNTFRGLQLRIVKFNYDFEDSLTPEERLTYLDDEDQSRYSRVEFKAKQNPSNGHAVPFVTGHRYHIHWDSGIDFTEFRVERSERWEVTDDPILFVTNHTDIREAFNVTWKGGQIEKVNTIDDFKDLYDTGHSGVNFKNENDKEFEFMINGRDPEEGAIDTIKVEGLKCIEGECPPEPIIGDDGIELSYRNWNQLASWDTEEPGVTFKIPEEGEDVYIAPSWNMLLNIAEPPQFNSIVIDGRLTFKTDIGDITLKANTIWVRKGQFFIGDDETPFPYKATIELDGGRESDPVGITSIEGGNKILANTGLIKWHGQMVNTLGNDINTFTRLENEAMAGDTVVQVGKDLGWEAGQRVAFAATTMQADQSDVMTIQSYVDSTGELTLTSGLPNYHYGKSMTEQDVADSYGGVDIRGEVVLLDRSIKVIGTDTDAWGCQLVTTDQLISLDPLLTARGETHLMNVLIENGGQEKSKPAVRFESSAGTGSSIKGSVIYNSGYYGLYIKSSSNIDIEDTTIVKAISMGIVTLSTSSITMDNMFVGGIEARTDNLLDGLVHKEACYSICALEANNVCSNTKLKNSVAAGCPYAGFVAPGSSCDDNDNDPEHAFYNNTAHSVAGNGALIYPDPSFSDHKTCYQGSHFRAYKCQEQGLITMFKTKKCIMRDMTMIDNLKGVFLTANGEDTKNEVEAIRFKIYGESEADDCGSSNSCFCQDKFGFMLFSGNQGTKSLHPEKGSSLPLYKLKSYGTFGIEVAVSELEFYDFQPETKCGRRQRLFERNPSSADYIPLHLFDTVKLTNVDKEAYIWIEDPNPAWASDNPAQSPDNCGNWPCTAPENVVLKFKRFTTDDDSTERSLQIVSNNPLAANYFDGCVDSELTNWNAYECTQAAGDEAMQSVLIFDGMNTQNVVEEDRELQPVDVFGLGDGHSYVNVINSMMDHGWDGSYSSQKRLQRFPIMVEAGKDYTVDTTGTPTDKLKFALRSDASAGIKVRVLFDNVGTKTVRANGNVVQPVGFDDVTRQPELLSRLVCGENRYITLANYLEFYITPGCTITVEPNDAIQGAVRMDWTLNEFYATGGTTSFIDRMASVLNIPTYRIYVVQIYQGSVIVDFTVNPAVTDAAPIVDDEGEVVDEEPDQVAEFDEGERDMLKQTLTATIEAEPEMITGGAGVLGFVEDGEVVAGEDIPPNPEIETLFPQMPTIDELQELFGVEIDDSDPRWSGFAIRESNRLWNKPTQSQTVLIGNDQDQIFIHQNNGHVQDVVSLGGGGNDQMKGSKHSDEMHGNEGNDVILGWNGDDLLHGGAGMDDIEGGGGNDQIDGGSGNDDIFGDGGSDTIHGGSGFDKIYGGKGHDTVFGGDDNDRIWGEEGEDYLEGGSGNDAIYGEDDNDFIFGEDGRDRLYGGEGDDHVSGGEGNDQIYGNGGDDIIRGDEGNDVIYGNTGDDSIQGNEGNDKIRGQDGEDNLVGGAGEDTLFGGNGDDILIGNDDDDVLWGDKGHDNLDGGEGIDILYGGHGDDVLFGGPGDDLLIGDTGNNSINGGSGSDTLMVFKNQNTRRQQQIRDGNINNAYKYYLTKFYDADGGDTILTGVGENIFYFTGPTELGETSIDILTRKDEIVFNNACGVATSVIPYEDTDGKMYWEASNDQTTTLIDVDLGDMTTFKGTWLVTVNSDQTSAMICKSQPSDCWTIDLPACGE